MSRGAYPKTLRRLCAALKVEPVDLLCAEPPKTSKDKDEAPPSEARLLEHNLDAAPHDVVGRKEETNAKDSIASRKGFPFYLSSCKTAREERKKRASLQRGRSPRWRESGGATMGSAGGGGGRGISLPRLR